MACHNPERLHTRSGELPMSGLLQGIRSSLRNLAAVALAATAAYIPTPTPGPSATPTRPVPTATPTLGHSATPTRTPTAGPILTSTPRPASVNVYSMQMMDATIGWAEGDVGAGDKTLILRTTDGGQSWERVSR